MMTKLAMFLGVIIILVILVFGFMFFEPFFSETEETMFCKQGSMEGRGRKILIFTENEVFLNMNNYYHNKSNANDLYPLFRLANIQGKSRRVLFPDDPSFRNVMSIIDKKETNVALPNK